MKLSKLAKLSFMMTMDGTYMLALAIAIWIPCIMMFWGDIAKPHLIANTFLYGTAYMIVARMVVAASLIHLGLSRKIEDVIERLEAEE